jgi:heat shock protein 1/8
MNVSATCKSTGKTQKITISNNKGRLSKDDIEKLVKEAETYKAEDEVIRKKIESKNTLENYTYSIRNTLKDEKLKDKFSGDERTKIESAVDETVKWLE